ncbi:AAA domain-containing protein [Capnocytophaga cynodegmi]|uniref:AAA domain-containing protein n=1 Tax=Capnocytophaga cynodegmi TaxID=28189 RepID=UPI001EE23AF5|nr:AAA domain-containing protein [Capnocytophaga cynodegmi]
MIFNKYQLLSEINERGYSSNAIVQNEKGEEYFAKWLRGIHKDSTPSKILSDKLRHLQKAKHKVLPQVIEYGWDETQKAYCIIFEYKRVNTLKCDIDDGNYYPNFFLRGILQIIDCLQQLNLKNRISHGDITPENILVDKDNNFYLIDFGITDIATTLSQAKEIEVFAREFAAPEKWNKEIEKGFPYQCDIYSIGKVIEWYFKNENIGLIDDLVKDICKNKPSDRPNYHELHTKISKIIESNSLEDEELVPISVRNNLEKIDFLGELNNEEVKPVFDISPKGGNNILLNVATKNYYFQALWRLEEEDLHITDYVWKGDQEENYKKTIQRGIKLEVPVLFEYKSIYYEKNYFSLKPFFDKILKQKQAENSYRNIKKNIYKELDFYKELIEKELEVIHRNSLRLQYTNFQKKSDTEIWFQIAKNEKYSDDSQVYTHIDKSMPPKPEEFEYILSSTADKKQIKKDTLKFLGTAYDFEKIENQKEAKKDSDSNLLGKILKFKDCEFIDFNKIPRNGYLFENISRQEEEKKRQQEALNKIRNNDVQNDKLIHYLFNPDKLESEYIDIQLEKIHQTDKDGKPYQYSYNQQKAIVNATHRKPLTVIQGPPGTGKTTVITEIVFQILNRDRGAKILITSQTNDAVDNVLDNLLEKNISLVRLSGVRKPKFSLQKHTLERKIEGWKEEVKKRTKENWKPIKNTFVQKLDKDLTQIFDTLSTDKNWNEKRKHIEKQLTFNEKYKHLVSNLTSEKEFLQELEKCTGLAFSDYFEKQNIYKDWLNVVSGLDEKSQINQKLIDTIRVIGATTSHIAAKKYAKYNFEFDYVIMDESGKATLPESLIPLVLGNNAVLVGDHRQLRPMLTSNKEVEKWLREKHKNEAKILVYEIENFEDYFNRSSLFENIIEKIDEDHKSQLEECRRMPKDAVHLTSKYFYEVFGDEAIKPVERPKEQEHNLDLKVDSSIIFLDIGNAVRSEIDGNGSSKNRVSANLIPQLLQKLDNFDRVKNYSIGVITGYKAQLREINKNLKPLYSNKLKRIKMKDVAVSVVDKFQGLEKDIIIFDLVRSNQNTLGFLANANRINVALSRHKKLLIIIGNYEWLLQAKSHNSSGKVALQNYLKAIKEEWRVNTIEQIF